MGRYLVSYELSPIAANLLPVVITGLGTVLRDAQMRLRQVIPSDFEQAVVIMTHLAGPDSVYICQ